MHATEVEEELTATGHSAQRRQPGSALEEKILGVWEDLITDGRAECPVCSGSIRADRPCGSCGSLII